MTALMVVLGGSLGAPSRWLLDQWIRDRYPGPFPLGTFVINMLGSFALGFLVGAATAGGPGPLGVALLGTGFCGAFTTFSTFGFEAVRLSEQARQRVATVYVLSSVALGIALACVGWALGDLIG